MAVWILAILHTMSERDLAAACTFARTENLRQGNGLALPKGNGSGLIIPGS